MQRFDNIFNAFSANLGISGSYDAKNINFDCLRATVSNFEEKCGRFSDYGLSFIKYFAHGCETIPTEVLLKATKC